MILQQVLLTDKYRISLEHKETDIFFRTYYKRSKKIERVELPNSFATIAYDYDTYKTDALAMIKKFYDAAMHEGRSYALTLRFKRGLPEDLTDEEHATIRNNIAKLKKKVHKERGVEDEF